MVKHVISNSKLQAQSMFFPIFSFFYPLFQQLVFQPLMSTQTIGDRQPIGLDY